MQIHLLAQLNVLLQTYLLIQVKVSLWFTDKRETDFVETDNYVVMEKNEVEMPGIEPGAFHMQSERCATELHRHLGR